jgi:hypothetical protein
MGRVNVLQGSQTVHRRCQPFDSLDRTLAQGGPFDSLHGARNQGSVIEP